MKFGGKSINKQVLVHTIIEEQRQIVTTDFTPPD